MKLALGPVQYYWPKDKLLAFYREVAQMPVDTVYLGETVCSRRHEVREDDWLEIAAMLDAAGKQVVLSTQVLLESGAHLQSMHRICENGRYPVEANDMGAVGQMESRGAFVAGPHLNLYSPDALSFVTGLGATRWVAPVEMSRENLMLMKQGLADGVETEVIAYGRLALAYSARCFTARFYNLQKDSCGFKCMNYPEGLKVKTREAQDFLVFNGIQTLSSNIYNLIVELPVMQEMGIDVARIYPQAEHTHDIVSIFDDVLEKRLSARDGLEKMGGLMGAPSCNGYWHAKPGMEWH